MKGGINRYEFLNDRYQIYRDKMNGPKNIIKNDCLSALSVRILNGLSALRECSYALVRPSHGKGVF